MNPASCHQVTLNRYSLEGDGAGSIPVGVVHNGIERLIHPLPENYSWNCPVGKGVREKRSRNQNRIVNPFK